MSTHDIYNFRLVDENTLTSGQPTAEQLRLAAAEGVQLVINLLPSDNPRALPDEGQLVTSLGMAYTHLPIDWANPTEPDLEAFDAVLQQRPHGKILIHCAANFRVTAFYSLYALKYLGWSDSQAATFRASIWDGSHYPAWEAFMQTITAKRR